MTVRRHLTTLLAFAVLLLGAGCGGNEGVSFGAETDDAVYQQGKQLQRQGRNPEALAAFLKVIERRGEQNAPESHLEVGLLLQRQDPIAAIYHFNKYLELQPSSKQAPLVRGLRDTAKREFARTLPGHPDESQSAVLDMRGQLERLQRENDALKAELDSRRGGAAPPLLRISRAPVTEEARPAPAATDDSPISLAPMPTFTTKPAAPAAPAARKHTVAPGDTLYGISKKYSVKIEDIATANRDVLPSVLAPLRVGTELKIP